MQILHYKMQISEKHVEKYQTIFFQEYGFEIDKARATHELISLVCLMNATYRHQNKDNYVRNNTIPPK